MQTGTGLEGTLQAPGPIIPTYRPSFQASKRTYSMSALAPKHQQYLSMADDLPSADANSDRLSSQNVTEIVRFLQTHRSSQASPQSTGPKDMLKAGQRRLRLALRTRKGADTKNNVDEASSQLAALRNQRSLPKPQYQERERKRSPASTSSSTKSASDQNFKSHSKTNVEEIGRPWLEHPLEKRDEPGSKGSSQVSSLDLRDLASFVEAAVSFSQFEDLDPPPYQPVTEQHIKPAVTAASSEPQQPPSKNLSSNIGNISRHTNVELPIASRSIHSVQSTILRANKELNQSFKELESKGSARLHQHPSSTISKSSSAPSTPNLKLFPDVMPPRTSSRNALRTSTVRSPTPTRCFSPIPGSRSTPALASVFQADTSEFRNSASSLPQIREDGAAERENTQPNTIRPLDVRVRRVKQKDRPSSLPSGAIDSFPIPAPVRPLPSVPEPLRVHDNSISSLDQPAAQAYSSPTISEPPINIPPGIGDSSPSSSTNSRPKTGNGATRGRDSPFPRLVIGERDMASDHEISAGSPALDQTRRGSLGKAWRSREAKVRSLIIRDLATSRHQKSSSGDQTIGIQATQTFTEAPVQLPRKYGSSQLETQQQYESSISPGHPLLLPVPLPLASQKPLQIQRYCTTPAKTMVTASENSESASRFLPSDNTRLQRKSSQRTEMKLEKLHIERTLLDIGETPLPSSDEEGLDGEFYRNPPCISSGRRRRRQAPTVVNKPTSDRGRSLKKRQTTSSIESSSQPIHRKQDFGKAHQTRPCLQNNRTYEPNAYHTPEQKINSSLEGRIENLERQNKILQAALLAALDVGVKQDLSSLLGVTPSPMGTSSSSTSNTASSQYSAVESDRPMFDGRIPYRPEAWIASPDSFDMGSYVSDGERELDEIIDEVDLNWLSDQSSVMS